VSAGSTRFRSGLPAGRGASGAALHLAVISRLAIPPRCGIDPAEHHPARRHRRTGPGGERRMPTVNDVGEPGAGEPHAQCAPRGALSYPRRRREELGGVFLGHPAHPNAKTGGDQSMPGKRWPVGGVLRRPPIAGHRNHLCPRQHADHSPPGEVIKHAEHVLGRGVPEILGPSVYDLGVSSPVPAGHRQIRALRSRNLGTSYFDLSVS
jgi:hypothetical protein